MERIKAFTVKKGFAKFQIIFGAVFLMIAMCLLIYDWRVEDKFAWVNAIFLLQGFLFIFLGYLGIRNDKYYIEWDDEQLNFFLPTHKVVESIKIEDIKDVLISLFEVTLELPKGTKKIKLEGLSYEGIRRIKDKFESIKASVESEPVYQ